MCTNRSISTFKTAIRLAVRVSLYVVESIISGIFVNSVLLKFDFLFDTDVNDVFAIILEVPLFLNYVFNAYDQALSTNICSLYLNVSLIYT